MAMGQDTPELSFHQLAIKVPPLVWCLSAAAGLLLKWVQEPPELNAGPGTPVVHSGEVLWAPRKGAQKALPSPVSPSHPGDPCNQLLCLLRATAQMAKWTH